VGCHAARNAFFGQVFTEPMVLGGTPVSAEVLNDGREAYLLYCQACHGEKGDGRGPAAPGMRPPPRDFTVGTFKFAGAAAGELPNDDTLDAIVRDGLDGTPMLPWDITARERRAVVQYIKTFADVWKTQSPGVPIRPDGPDPWRDRPAEAIALGEKIYHLLGAELDPVTKEPRSILAGCNACHPTYLTRVELADLSQRVLGTQSELRPDPHFPARKPSEYGAGDQKIDILPTDFLFHPIKNGARLESLYRSIAAGIGGTAMPQWKGALKDPELWALAHYVRDLASMRGTPRAVSLRGKLAREAQP
jgi:mono/diheme cytochrome c family protein